MTQSALPLSNDLSLLLAETRAFLARPHGHYIDGRWTDPAAGDRFAVIDPTGGDVLAEVARGGAADIDQAVRAARAAFDEGPWPRLKTTGRERVLLRLAELLAANATQFSELETLESGRSLVNTRLFDVDLSVDYLRYMAGWCTKITGETIPVSTPYMPAEAAFFACTLREPVGVVGAITPWNVPLGQAIWKLAPALATGCCIVLKPAEQTPLTALRFAALLEEAGVPAGVVNIVTGFGHEAGAALVEHPGVDKLAFTGSTEVGRHIGMRAASQMKPCTLELGGKSPVIVMPDADLDAAIPGAAWAIFGNHGQNCIAGSRLFVHESVYEEVVSGVARIATAIRLGSPLVEGSEMGPLVSFEQQQRVLEFVQSGLQQGARLLAGGEALSHPGCYVQPTVLADTTADMRVVQEEIFGPVVCAMRFSDTDDAVRRANDTRYGLGASIWTRDLATAHRLIPRLDAGMVWVNTHNVLDLAVPFGGFKQSGMGKELGRAAIEHHTRLKSAIISL